MKLKQTLEHKVTGYWDGGYKSVFHWSVDRNYSDGKSRVGSWEANHFFEVKTGKTEKQTLCNAMKHLRASTRVKSTFEYIEE